MTESEPWSYHADGTPVTSLADVIRKRAAATPDGIALVRAGQVTTFAGIEAGSSQAAAALRAAGVATPLFAAAHTHLGVYQARLTR